MNDPQPASNEQIIFASHSKSEDVTFLGLFRFAQQRDLIYICIGSVCSMVIGGALPVFSMLWGNLANAFGNSDEMVSQAYSILIQYVIFGTIATFAGWGMQYFWLAAGQNQANECRKQFLASLMKQEIGWFETQHQSEIISKFIADSLAFQLAVGEKVPLMIYILSMFVSGLVIAVINGWQLALVVLAFLPVFIFSWWLMELFARTRSKHEQQIFEKANIVMQEVLSSIKIVKQLNGQQHQAQRFLALVKQVKQKSHSHNIRFALSQLFCFFCLLFSFLLTYWYGSQCVQNTSNCRQNPSNSYSGGTVLTVFFCLILPAMNLNQLVPSFKTIIDGKLAANRLFLVIDRVPTIRSPQNPIKINILKGIFQLKDVSFAYPKEKARKIFSNLSLRINSRHVGIMGESGSGKSTLLQLMMRFYDPDSGVITLDGIDIRELDLRWLRQQIGYVAQEPLLFSISIRKNLLIGKSNASRQEMMEALRKAEMLDFVMGLSDEIETYVGDGGSQLSGGQKQRIAIARALLKDPQIIFLDQATSALDRRNQRSIQERLDNIVNQKLSITIAHKIKTIKNCEEILIIEKGNHANVRKFQEIQKRQIYDLRVSDNAKVQQAPVQAINNVNISIELLNNLNEKTKDSFFKLQLTTATIPDNGQSKQEDKKQSGTYRRLIGYTSGSKWLISLGLLSSIVHGLVIPSMGIHVARVESFQVLYSSNPSYYSQQIQLECLYMLITCIVGPVALALQFFVFHYLGSNIVNSIRAEAYNKVVRLPLSWFENPDNNPEQMSVKLGADIYLINHIISRYFSHLTVAISSVVFGFVIAFFFEWRTALVSIVLIPLIGFIGLVQAKMLQGYLTESRKLYEQSVEIITEAITKIKTVVSFCYQAEIIANYTQSLENIEQRQYRKKVVTGLIFGLSYFLLFLVNGLIFYLSALFIRDNKLQMTNAFSAVFVVLFCGAIAGNNIKSVPDLSQLKITGEKLFNIIDLEDEDQLQRRKGSRLLRQEIKGNIQFRDVSFKYDNREQLALKGVSFQVKEGEKVGIVGPSGCGKSTILRLLLGFYSCQKGEIIIDGHKIEDYDIHFLRSQFGIVEQEPALFDESIEYNIVYNHKEISRELVKEVADRAELIHAERERDGGDSFFERKAGPRGSHLSGGEKQRVAIARAILRNPIVMLLDEPTSALDKQNKEKVEQCLDSAMKGRTTLSVTHNLEYVRNASQIFVLDNGQMVEKGVYEKLLEQKGSFYRLLNDLELK